MNQQEWGQIILPAIFLSSVQGFFQKIPFDKGIITSFSAVYGTEAKTMEPKVTTKEMKKRMRCALKMLKDMNYFAWYSRDWNGISYRKKEK